MNYYLLKQKTSYPMGSPISFWLFCVIILLILLISIGGITRLTESGLSITEWNPIIGIFYPISDGAWLVEFEKYKTIPEYIIVNNGMSLPEFKVIYFWEWFHRFVARILGLVFFIPFVYFIIKNKLSNKEKIILSVALVFGICQAGVGWYMVQSGLVTNINVSQYRLALHLALAFVILGLLVFALLTRLSSYQLKNHLTIKILRNSSALIFALVFIQIILGAFVSGTRSGLSYNTWPLMDGQLVPGNLFIMQKWYTNFFDNPVTIQFDHRLIAYLLFVVVLTQYFYINKFFKGKDYHHSSKLLFIVLFLQIIIGIMALVYQVPIFLGLLHQIGAVFLFIIALRHLYISNH